MTRRTEERRFDRYVGIDYSGAATPTTPLSGLRVYMAEADAAATEVRPAANPRRHWSRRAIAEWLAVRLAEPRRTIVGIDHGFSFPLRSFEAWAWPRDWPAFLDEFTRRWPTDADSVSVQAVRDGDIGTGAERPGDARWRRIVEQRTGAKSVFHFDVPGSVAKSTHAGLPWLRFLRRAAGDRLHCWPFDGWEPAPDRCVLAEMYPSLASHSFPRDGRGPDQHDAYTAAAWLRQADRDGTLAAFLAPSLSAAERAAAETEGWILGVS